MNETRLNELLRDFAADYPQRAVRVVGDGEREQVQRQTAKAIGVDPGELGYLEFAGKMRAIIDAGIDMRGLVKLAARPDEAAYLFVTTSASHHGHAWRVRSVCCVNFS